MSQSSIGAHYSKQNMIKFSQCLAELVQKLNFFKLAVLRSDSMKRNYGDLIFTVYGKLKILYCQKVGMTFFVSSASK